MEIEVGEYVRNRYGIAKVVGIENNNGIEVLIFDRNICFFVDKKTGEIKDDRLFNKLALIEGVNTKKIKHSKDIIDLVEQWDIVNEFEVQVIYITSEGKKVVSTDCGDSFYDQFAYNEDIKTILTHEQIEQNCYRLEEK